MGHLTSVIPTIEDLDADVLATMNSLQCFRDKDKLLQELLNSKHNTEKVVYFLLLDRKLRNPARDDEEEIKAKSESSSDPPRKRVDAAPLTLINGQPPRLSLGSLSEGSPLAPRRALTIQHLRRKNSLQNLSVLTGTSPSSSPRPIPRITSTLAIPTSSSSLSGTSPEGGCDNVFPPTPPGSPSPVGASALKARLNIMKNNLFGSPRFHRKKMQVPSREDLSMTAGTSTEFTKKSWFGTLMGSEKEERCFIMIKDRNMGQIKADLIHAFICMPDLTHSVVTSTSYRCEYRKTSNTMFSRNVRLQIDLAPVGKDDDADGGDADYPLLHCVTFTLLSGQSRRFRRLSELFQSMLLNSNNRNQSTTRHISSDLASNSSSSSYNSMDGGTSPTPPDDTFDRRSTHQSTQVLASGRKTARQVSGGSETGITGVAGSRNGSSSRDLQL